MIKALLLAVFLPLASQDKLELPPEEVESIVDAVFNSAPAKDWARGATEQEQAAAKFQLQDWVYQHPDEAVKVNAGLVLDQAKFQSLLAQYFDYCMDPEKSFNQLDRVATLSDQLAASRGMTADALRAVGSQVFEGGGLGLERPLQDALAPVDWERVPATGLKLDPAAFARVREDGARRLSLERDALSADRREASELGVSAAMDAFFLDRDRAVGRADVALRDFGSVLAKRPQAAESLTKQELRLLSHSRNDLYRWLAAAGLARAESRFRRLLAQLETPDAARRITAGLPLSERERAAYARRLDGLKARLRAYLASAERPRKLLAEGDELDLKELSRLVADDERRALALEGEVRELLEAPALVRRAERRQEALSWWRRLVRWFFVTFLPNTAQARAYAAEAASRRVLLAELHRAAR